MLWATIPAFVLGVFIGAALMALAVAPRYAVRRRVVVNLDTGRAFTGVLWRRRGPLLVLRDATLHDRGTEPAAVDGEVVLEVKRVEFVQVTGG